MRAFMGLDCPEFTNTAPDFCIPPDVGIPLDYGIPPVSDILPD